MLPERLVTPRRQQERDNRPRLGQGTAFGGWKRQSLGTEERPLRRSKHLLAFLVLALCALGFGVASAIAEPPQVTAPQVSEVSYTSAHLKGEVDPQGEGTSWFFEVSKNGTDWERTNVEGYLEGSGLQTVEGDVSNLNWAWPPTGLKPGTTYEVRLHASNGSGDVTSPEPNPEFTTKSLPAPTVSIDPVTTFTGTTAHFSGEIDPNAPAGNPEASDVKWHFQCTPECPGIGGDKTVKAEEGNTVVEVDAEGLEPNTAYEVTLIGKNGGDPVEAGPVSFTTTAVVPEVETLPAFAIQGGTEALVGARINPRNSATTYWFEYGATESYGENAPAGENGSAGSGGGWQIFTQTIAGLAPSTEYHFRVVAESPAGPKALGGDETFETAPAGPAPEPNCPNAALRTENNSSSLPDCRAYEQVSPQDKNGFDAGANSELEQQRYVASEDGEALLFQSFGAFADAQGAGVFNSYIARRESGSWVSHAQTPAQLPSTTNKFASLGWVTPDLRYGVVDGGNQGHLAPGDNPAMANIYRRDTITGSYETLNLGATDAKPVNSSYTLWGGSSDASRIFFDTPEALTPDAVEGGGNGFFIWENLYEWHEGKLKLASLIPSSGGGEESAPEGTSGAEEWIQVTSPVSTDGLRAAFWDNASGHSFLREDGARSLDMGPGVFRGGSADLSKIFLRSSTLYRFEPETETVTDLLASALPGPEHGGDLVAVSRDGEYAYFVSPARFHAGENPSGGRALYLWHNGQVTFIAKENGTTATAGFANTYRVSPDGRRLSFAATERLTAYDNNGESEVYTYDATTDRLTCVSCNPSGQSPTGASMVPTPPESNRRSWQPGVRDDGSIFFSSRDALVPEDVNGKTDVYEWKEGRVRLISTGTSGSVSYLASSSVSGNDVFFLTRQRLVPSDQDDNVDIYDARVGGGFPQAAPPNPCEGIEGCHGAGSSAPPFDDPASGSFSSLQKQPSPKAERLRKALKTCKHKKKKKARAKCRAAAKKRYGKGSNGRAH